MAQPDPASLLAALDDPLGAGCLDDAGEPDLDRARELLPPLVGPTFVGDRWVTRKPVVRADGTVEGLLETPLAVEPGEMACPADTIPSCVGITGHDPQGRLVERAVLAVEEEGATSVWCLEYRPEPWCVRCRPGAAPEERTVEAFDQVFQESASAQFQDLAGAASLNLPAAFRLPARLSLVRALNALVGVRPKYGWGGYEAARHDSFPPIILSLGHALCDVGLLELAKELVGHWLDSFVLPDGALDYYGPSLSEAGMLLDLVHRTGRTCADEAWSAEALGPCRRVADRLLRLRDQAGDLLAGLPEADLHQDAGVEETVYYSNNLWCVRGLRRLASWLGDEGEAYRRAAEAWLAQTHAALRADAVPLAAGGLAIPAVRGGGAPARLTADRAASYANYRFYPEMLSSGLLGPCQAEGTFRLRETRGGELCGTTRFADWLDDWPAMEMGLAHLDHGRASAAQRLLVGHLACHHAAGHETVYEQVTILPDEQGRRRPKAGFCVPAQLVAPRLLRHLLVHETADGLLLNPGGFRRWLAEGYGAEGVTTPWGTISFAVAADGDGVAAVVDASGLRSEVPLRLRLQRPDGLPPTRLELDAEPVDAADGWVTLPCSTARSEVRAT